MTTESDKPNKLTILVATDNHVGVWEQDEIRKNDSFETFDEVFRVAQERRADMVLLGGDLFHDNKPSRTTLVRTMNILTRHCLNDNPVGIEILSKQEDNFVSGRANFEHPDYNIGLPVFTIHGNHDDPSGPDQLSAVDVLSSSNLVNYFGKACMAGSGIGKVVIKPVLLRKGRTKVALYGLGNIRDERLCRMFQTPGCVEWQTPADSPEFPAEDWVNVLVLHQNRATHTQSARNVVKESYLPSFLDVVVWGHEHECIPTSINSAAGYTLLQPGSTVATSLSEGEAKKKHVVVLEIVGTGFQTIFQDLRTVRPFKFDQVVLAQQPDVELEDPEGVAAFLEGKVKALVDACGRERRGVLPLVRLRVDYTGLSTINSQRFGQKFVGRVANPHDVLHWHKSKKPKASAEKAEVAAAPPEESHIEDLVAQNLADNLAILPEVDLAHALHDYVDKDEKHAWESCVSKALQATQSAVTQQGPPNNTDDEVAELLLKHAESRKATARETTASRAERASVSLPPPTAEKAAADSESDHEAPSASKRRGPGRGRGRGRGVGRQATLQDTVARSRAKGGLSLTPAAQTAEAALQRSRAKPSQTPGRQRSQRQASTVASRRLATTLESEGSDVASEPEAELVEDSDSEDPEPASKRPRRGAVPTRRQAAARPTPAASMAATAESEPIALESDDDLPMTATASARQVTGSLFGSSKGRRGRR